MKLVFRRVVIQISSFKGAKTPKIALKSNHNPEQGPQKSNQRGGGAGGDWHATLTLIFMYANAKNPWPSFYLCSKKRIKLAIYSKCLKSKLV